MNSQVQYTNLNEFLIEHSAKKDKSVISTSHTHTRIPDQKLNIYGGSYNIPPEKLPIFMSLYYEQVFIQHKMEYLTEKQIDNGPILIDIDFRYEYAVTERKHTHNHISDLIDEYLMIIKELVIIKPNVEFPVYVFEKPTVNRLQDGSLTKDGVHIIIGIKLNHILQQMLRKKILEKITELWDKEDIPIINDYDSVFDEGISKGTTNWQMFGSRKP